MQLVIRGSNINVEHAADTPTRQLGLMYRNFLPPNAGMLFSFPDSSDRSFWMKNTYIPLSIAYIDEQGVILNIEDMEPQNLDGVRSVGPAMYALETNKGWFDEHGISAGDIVQGLMSRPTMVSEAREFNLSSPDFYYREAVEEVVEGIMTQIGADISAGSFTDTYLWDYPITPATWIEYYEDDGAAFFDVNVDITPMAFEEDHPGWNIDADAGFGESSEASIQVRIQFDENLAWTPEIATTIEQELFNALPHEIHHLTQRGKPFERPNCPATPPAEGDSYFNYFTQACEVPAFLIGFRGEASRSGMAIEKLIDTYLNNYVQVGKISTDESQKVKTRWLGHEQWNDKSMQEALLRNYVRQLLIEATTLPQEYFAAIDDAVSASQFWEQPNSQEDIDEYSSTSGSVMGTPAAIALSEALHQAMEDVGLDIDILVRSHYTTDIDGMTLHPDHPAWPDRWLIDAKWYVSKERPGRNTIDIEIMTSEEEDDILSSLDQAALMRHITQTVRHELVHYQQMKRQADSKEISEMEAFKEMLADPSQVPNRNKPKYWEVWEPTGKIDPETGEEIIQKDGWKHEEYTQDYLRSHIEVDAHAHDGAEELLAVYGKEDSLDMLRHGFDTTDPKMPNAIKHYFEMLPADDPTLDKFRKKLYTQLDRMS